MTHCAFYSFMCERSLTISPAIISPATDGTNAVISVRQAYDYSGFFGNSYVSSKASLANNFNSNDYEATLTNIATHKGVCLAPGFLNNHYDEFAWTPFNCPETISCVLCTHAGEQNENVYAPVKLLRKTYIERSDFIV